MDKNVDDIKNKDEIKSIDLLRERLLDLSARNKLLNFKHSKTHIRVIDELSDQLYDHLLENLELRFLSIPRPTRDELIKYGYLQVNNETGEEELIHQPSVTEWAKILGYNIDYELPNPYENPAKQHQDDGIQTLFFPEELEYRLRHIYNKAKVFEEETGTSILYLIFGFLEWYESIDSKSSRLAPLYFVPVRLTKGKLDKNTNTFIYTISYSDEDLIPNLSLREKLKNDFGIFLPEIKDDTENEEDENKPGIKPEKYLSIIKKILKNSQPRWKVHRYCTLGMLHFGKLLLYLDLDPKNWPSEYNIEEHTVVCSLLGKNHQIDNASNDFSSEYDIDALDNIHHEYPLIDDADSSQHSVLIDAINCKNLVVEGPPGTGKSQTIANLIASAIAKGKSVLFVTEKLVALEVVKRRLDNAGLGDFCLELHSNKTQKSHVINGISQRIQNQNNYRNSVEIEHEISIYEKHKNDLVKYASEITKIWKDTELSAYEIITGFVRYRIALDNYDIDMLSKNNLDHQVINKKYINNLKELIFEFEQAYMKIISHVDNGKHLDKHPWFGINNIDIQVYDINNITDQIVKLQETIKSINNQLNYLEIKISQDEKLTANRSIEYVKNIIDDLKFLPEVERNNKKLIFIKENSLDDLRLYLDLYNNIQKKYINLKENGNTDIINNDVFNSLDIQSILKITTIVPVKKSITICELKSLVELCKETINIREKLSSIILHLKKESKSLFCDALNISEYGLNNLIMLIELYNNINVTLLQKRNTCFEDTELDNILKNLEPAIKYFNDIKPKLNRYFDLESSIDYILVKSIRYELSGHWIIGIFRKSWWFARKQLKILSKEPNIQYKYLHHNLPLLCDYLKEIEKLNAHTKYFNLLGELYNGADTDIDLLKEVRSWYKHVNESCSFSIDNDKTLLATIAKSLPTNIAVEIRAMKNNGIFNCISETLDKIAKIKSYLDDSQIKNLDLLDSSNINCIDNLLASIKQTADYFDQHFTDNEITYEEYLQSLEDLISLNELLNTFNNKNINDLIPDQDLKIKVGVEADISDIKIAEKILIQSEYIDKIKSESIKKYLYKHPEATCIYDLIGFNKILEDNLFDLLSSYSDFVDIVKTSDQEWANNWKQDINLLFSKNQYALDNKDKLIHWIDYINLRLKLEKAGIYILVQCIENGTLPISMINVSYFYIIYNALVRDLYKNNTNLRPYFIKDLSTLRSLFQKCDSNLKYLQRQHIASIVSKNHVPRGTTGRLARDFTEMCLLERECAKQKRHIPIRKLIQQASSALLALKPCFMMGPLAVAQYLRPGLIQFDLVIMDEASQIKPEDAIGAIARGKQSVIIGDPKQLPPTNFFSNMMEDIDDEDEQTLLSESESILDAALPVFNKRRLRWHYRSQHESLIAFSNSNFYHSDLIIFPSPHHHSESYGVKVHYLENAKFSNNVNNIEAQAITAAIIDHLLSHSEESLGVVAMNLHQADLIDSLLEQSLKNEPLAQSAYDLRVHDKEPIFIKNLENVQGDERDVIFISTTYGPNEQGGKVYQRFGPINNESGWRRLNVLFTRSKKRMHLFTSLKPEDIVVSSSSKKGVKSLRDFLSYANTGILDQAILTNKNPDSDFEVAVANALIDAGFEVDYQVGVAGFYIDIAIKHPTRQGFYLMGVECDGATYHSSKSARDNDRLRQEILESKGWKIRRIWSTDWFKDYKSIIKPIIDELRTLTAQ